MREKQKWNIIETLNWTADYFRKNTFTTPRLDAEILLAGVLGVERITLYTHYDRPLSAAERAAYRALVKRRIAGEPVSYIRKQKEFWSRLLYVDKRVLIPRPETETVVEVVKERFKNRAASPGDTMMDVCCGSGALGLAIASFMPGKWVLTDLDADALAVAKINCEKYSGDGPFFHVLADLFKSFGVGSGFDLIVSNPPYVKRSDLPALPAGIRNFEPMRALDGGADGLEILKRLVAQGPAYLAEGGLFVTEIAPDQAEDVTALFGETGKFTDIQVARDILGHQRVVSAWRN